jgi:hypothetical protein
MLGGAQLGQHHHSIPLLCATRSAAPSQKTGRPRSPKATKLNQECFQLKTDLTLALSTKMSRLISDNSRSNSARAEFALRDARGIPNVYSNPQFTPRSAREFRLCGILTDEGQWPSECASASNAPQKLTCAFPVITTVSIRDGSELETHLTVVPSTKASRLVANKSRFRFAACPCTPAISTRRSTRRSPIRLPTHPGTGFLVTHSKHSLAPNPVPHTITFCESWKPAIHTETQQCCVECASRIPTSFRIAIPNAFV